VAELRILGVIPPYSHTCEPFSPNRIGEVRERESYLFLVGVVLLVKQVTFTKTI
jgi:hypothetical protein